MNILIFVLLRNIFLNMREFWIRVGREKVGDKIQFLIYSNISLDLICDFFFLEGIGFLLEQLSYKEFQIFFKLLFFKVQLLKSFFIRCLKKEFRGRNYLEIVV